MGSSPASRATQKTSRYHSRRSQSVKLYIIQYSYKLLTSHTSRNEWIYFYTRVFFLCTEHRDELTMPDDLVRHIHQINNVFERVVSTREAAIDAEGFLLLSTIGRENAESTAGDLIFDPVIFSEKLVCDLSRSHINLLYLVHCC